MTDVPQSKKAHAISDLKKRVLTVELAPGTVLDEVLLSTEYGLSRTPMREVLQRLAGEGYINLEKNRGASVSSMDISTMRAFFQTAPMVYAAIARLATEQASAAQISQLKKIQQQFTRAVNKVHAGDMAMYNHRFHEHLGVMAASPYLTPSLGRLLIDHTRMSQRFYRPDNDSTVDKVATACQQHDQMIDAIENRQTALSVDVTLQHWELSRNEIDKYVLPDPLPIDAVDALEGIS